MDQALNQKIDAYIAQNKEQLLKDIAALVAVNSVEGTPEEGAPFGAGPRAALDKTLELAAGMGFAAAAGAAAAFFFSCADMILPVAFVTSISRISPKNTTAMPRTTMTAAVPIPTDSIA